MSYETFRAPPALPLHESISRAPARSLRRRPARGGDVSVQHPRRHDPAAADQRLQLGQRHPPDERRLRLRDRGRAGERVGVVRRQPDRALPHHERRRDVDHGADRRPGHRAADDARQRPPARLRRRRHEALADEGSRRELERHPHLRRHRSIVAGRERHALRRPGVVDARRAERHLDLDPRRRPRAAPPPGAERASGAVYGGPECFDPLRQPSPPPFFRSDNNGMTWTNVAGTLPWHVVASAVRPTDGWVYALTEGAGLFVSANKGATWHPLANNPAPSDSLLMDAKVPTRLFG